MTLQVPAWRWLGSWPSDLKGGCWDRSISGFLHVEHELVSVGKGRKAEEDEREEMKRMKRMRREVRKK